MIGVDDPDAKVQRQRCMKELHVSPFMGMEIEYRFRVVDRRDGLTIGIADYDCDGLLMSAALTAERRPLTDRALLAAFARMPFETVKVTAAIHWEALRLWLKGARFIKGPAGSGKAIERHSASARAGGSSSSRRQRERGSAAHLVTAKWNAGLVTPRAAPAKRRPMNAKSEAAENMLSSSNRRNSSGGKAQSARAAAQLNGDEGQKYQPDQAPGPPRLIRPE